MFLEENWLANESEILFYLLGKINMIYEKK